ncbi:MAG TPA: heme-binding protein [Methylomirabilota bacterium]|nr:heme-binding protein [Methylomirabilota bacterium]
MRTHRPGILLALLVVAALALFPARASAAPFLTAADVTAVVQAAANSVSTPTLVIAVVDRGGEVLAVYHGPTATAADTLPTLFSPAVTADDIAVGLARTGAFFSNNQAPLSSRTVRFISGIHFPPGFTNTPPAALYGIENTNRGCSFNVAIAGLPRAKSFTNGAGNCQNGDTAGCGAGIVTGKHDLLDSVADAVNPGGVPIFKNGELVGGIGVSGLGVEGDVAEFAAFTGSIAGPGFGPVVPDPGTIFLNGIQLPFVKFTGRPASVGTGTFVNAAFAAGVGGFTMLPIASPNGAAGAPEGYLVGPIAGTKLTVLDVQSIIDRGRREALQTRAAIRLPLGSPTAMVLAVGDVDGTLLAVYRMHDATIFSVDVAVTKARNAVYFSSPTRDLRDIRGVPRGTAVTARTLGFGAMPLYPPGIDNTRPGPFFGNFAQDAANPCTQGFDPNNLANQSGIVFFPGSMPLYRGASGPIVGGLGVSGDGVEQDDFVTAAAVTDLDNPSNAFAPPLDIRADRIVIGGVRLPFLKFPRNPEVR